MGMKREATHGPPAPGATGVGSWIQLAGAAVQFLREIRDLLAAVRPHVAFGAAGMEQRLDNWPVAGQKRLIVGKKASGGGQIAVPAGANAVDILPDDPGTAGRMIVNYGTSGCFLFAGRAGDVNGIGAAGVDCTWLSPNGGSWDGKIGSNDWCGAISAQSTGGTNLAVWAI